MQSVNATTITAIVLLLTGCIWIKKDDSHADSNLTLSDMVFVPAGKFIMGSNEGQANERPKRQVYVDAFYIDKYEVTNLKYKKFLTWIEKYGDHSKCHPDEPKNKDHTPNPKYCDLNQQNMPVVGIDWYDAYAYAAWIGKRLPTEAEWEKAARGPNGLKYPWGNDWSRDKCALETIKPVITHPKVKSPYGCYDMVGNAREWTATRYSVKNLICKDGDLPPVVSDISYLFAGIILTTWYKDQIETLRKMPKLKFQYRWEGGMLQRIEDITGEGFDKTGKQKETTPYTIKGGRVLLRGAWDMRASYRASATPLHRDKFTGFRCAKDP